MALSNKERVGRVLDRLVEGLAPFVVREYRMHYKGDYIQEIDRALATQAYDLPREALQDAESLIAHLDVQNTLNLMIRNWRDVFQDKLGHNGRNYTGEMMDIRVKWAHQQAFTNDEAYRAADTAGLLLRMVSAADQAAEVEEIAKELLRQRYEQEARRVRREVTPKQAEMPTTTLKGLKPWREVVQPHRDVASGRYIQAEFAADLAQVLAGTAEAEYQDPREFFRRTYLTEGLVIMLVSGVKRLTAQGGEPVVQLQTAFGGGKTHSMLALYHLAAAACRWATSPEANASPSRLAMWICRKPIVAVLVGTALDPSEPRQYPEANGAYPVGRAGLPAGRRRGL
jgi:uncharacterized protein